jgi:hypothetical protein
VKSKVTGRQIGLTGESKGDKRSFFLLAKLIKSGHSTQWRLQNKVQQAASVDVCLFHVGFEALKRTNRSPFLPMSSRPVYLAYLRHVFHLLFYTAAFEKPLISIWSV